MNCNEALPLLDLLYDELLETKDSALVLDHLKNCDDCRREWESMDELRTRITAAKENTTMPSDLMDRVSTAIKNDAGQKRFLGLLPQQIPIATIAASILLLGWVIVPQYLQIQRNEQGTLASRTSSAQTLIANLTASGALSEEQDKAQLDKRLGYSLKYVHLPTWKMENSGVYKAQANIARFDFVRETNPNERLCCYQGLEGTIEATGDSQQIDGKRVTFGNQGQYQFAKFSQNGRDYLFVTKLPKAVLEDIIRST